MGKAAIRGEGALDFANRCLSNDLGRIAPGSAQYTLALTESGTVTDDLMAYLRSETELFLIPNAANTAAVVAALEAVGLPQPSEYMSFVDATISLGGSEIALTVCRTGYTGELGYEVVPAWADSATVWEALAAAVEKAGGRAAGLGARDTLRTEMGYALHGRELSTHITAVEAGVGWAVGWKKDAFWGKEALTAQKAVDASRKSVGLLATERGVPRADVAVLDADGNEVGRTTSGTFSPTLDIRGRRLGVTVVKPPFVQVNVKA